MKHARLTSILFCLFLLAAILPASAATLNVPSQYPTIQAGINAAQPGDTVLVADGTYTGAGNRDIDFNGKSLTVRSVNGPASTIIDCSGSASSDGSGNHRGFYLHSNELNVTISGFTVKNGYEAYYYTSPGGDYGGGIYSSNGNSGAITITNCTVTGNTAQQGGGGIYNGYEGNGTITVSNCTITGNTAHDGAGIENANEGGTIIVTGCNVSNNTGLSGCGGIENTNENSDSINNDNDSIGTITVTNCIVSGNTAGNGADSGGMLNDAVVGTITVTYCTISANSAGGFGGGVGNSASSGYSSSPSGSELSGAVLMANCTIVGNAAQRDGGGIDNSASVGTVTETNCTIVGNNAASGGGIYNVLDGNGGTITLNNCTLSTNASRTGGGIENYNNGGEIVVTNDILYDDSSEEIFNETGDDGLTVSHCDVQGGYVGMGNINADPLFVRNPSITSSASDFGDLHLQSGSPCIGTGTANGAPLTDKDGATRLTPPTIGAYDRPAHTWDATAIAIDPDGLSRLLWADIDGRNSVWTLSSTGSATSTPILQRSGSWTLKDVSLDAQGSTHVLWINPDGRMTIWSFQQYSSGQYSTDTSLPIYQPGDGWEVQALSVDSMGNNHVLWFNTDGRMAVWTIGAGGNVSSSPIFQPGDGWSARSLSVDAQNRAHVLWFNTDGRMSVWTIDASNNVKSTAIYQPGGNWEAKKVAVDAQGNAHVLWFNTDGRMSVWSIDATSNVRSTPIFNPGSGWAAQGLAVDSAGSNRVLWDNPDGRTAVWTIPVQGTVTSTPIYQP